MLGPHQGRKIFTLQTLPSIDEAFTSAAGNVAGFSLHAGVAVRAHEHGKLERLCRCIALQGGRVLKSKPKPARFRGLEKEIRQVILGMIYSEEP